MTASEPDPSSLARRVAQLVARLDEHRQRLDSLEHGDAALGPAVEDLLELVRTYGDHEAYSALTRTGAIEEYRSAFAPYVLRFVWSVEHDAYDALRRRSPESGEPVGPLLGPNTWGAYARMAETLELVDAARWTRFLMVGCGPLPDSLLCMHDRTEVPVLVGVDRDPGAVHKARELVGALNLERVEILESDAQELDYAGFDAVCCSIFATPRRSVMERIAESASPDSVVLLRDPIGTGTLLFEPILDNLPDRFAVRSASATPPGRFMLRYFVLGLTG